MGISLSLRTQKLIEDRMKTGGFATADAVIQAALESLDQSGSLANLRSEDLEAIYPDLRAKIAEGLSDLQAGRLIDGKMFFAEIDQVESKNRGSEAD